MASSTSNEHDMLRTMVQRFVAQELMPHEDLVGRRIEAKGKEAGLFAANLPESIGGGGLDYEAMRIIEREFGKTSHALHAWVARPTEILLGCEGAQIERYLKPCVTGEKRELFALTEPEAGSDIMSMKSNAKWDGKAWVLNGSKHFISGPTMPDFAIVFAVSGIDETPRGSRKRVTAFLVDVGTPGFDIKIGNRSVSYRGYNTYALSFSDVRLSPEQILGKEGEGLELAGKWLGMGRVWVGASCCGKAERLFALATEWAANRKQFGQAIGKFQATGFKLADMAVEMRAAELLVDDAVQRANAGEMTDVDASMVKLYCSEMLNRVADATVQIYGGMGLMEELPVQRLWRDSRLERIWDGTSEIQRHIISRAILRPLGA